MSGHEDASNLFSKGRYLLGKEIIDECMDRIRSEVEHCSNLQGFMIYTSISCGTGSGLGSLICESLSVEY